jgi:uncharacterized membrane protein YozB (DUF420 family)
VDAKLLFWTGALVNMAVAVGVGARGIQLVRRGDVARHRRAMLTASALVLGFVGAYVVKLAALGGEDLDVWSTGARGVLYFHETCVALMLIAGAVAGRRAWQLRRTRRITGSPAHPAAAPAALHGHRRAGRTALLAAVLGVLSATVMLAGMYSRADAVRSGWLTWLE